MDPQIANFLTNLEHDIDSFLNAWQAVEDRFQEAFDRGIPDELATMDFGLYGDLAYLTEAKLVDGFAAYQSIKAAMDASGRLNWERFYQVVR
jgi:hypothetical protein